MEAGVNILVEARVRKGTGAQWNQARKGAGAQGNQVEARKGAGVKIELTLQLL